MASKAINIYNDKIHCATFIAGDQVIKFTLTSPESVKEFIPILREMVGGKIHRNDKTGQLTFEIDSKTLSLDSDKVQQQLSSTRNIEGYLSSRLVHHQFSRWSAAFVPLEANMDMMVVLDDDIDLGMIEEIPPEYRDSGATPQQLQQKNLPI
jgi:nitrate reductase NapAB chaperone NapD